MCVYNNLGTDEFLSTSCNIKTLFGYVNGLLAEFFQGIVLNLGLQIATSYSKRACYLQAIKRWQAEKVPEEGKGGGGEGGSGGQGPESRPLKPA